MKRALSLVSLLLCLIFAFSSCSLPYNNETISKIVSDISENISSEQEKLDNNYNGRSNYYYSSLSDEEKTAYTKIYNAYIERTAFTVNLERSKLEYMINCVLYDNPEIFWVGSNYSFSSSSAGIYVEPQYRFTEDESRAMKIKLESAVNKILAELNPQYSDYAKEKYFHDYICKETVYDLSTYDGYGDSAYSALVEGKAICEGYARAMKMLLDASNIYNYLVIGNTINDDGETEGHMWNILSLDGDLYHVDVTWDDDDNVDVGDLYYLYFNITDEDIYKDHFDIEPSNNNCTSRKYNYYSVNGLFFNSFNNFVGMAEPCGKNITDDLVIEMRFANRSDYDAIMKKVMNHQYDDSLFAFTSEVAKVAGKNIEAKSYIYNDDYNYLCIVFERG